MFGKTLEQLKQAFASGEEILKEDEYLGNDGLPYCKACKTARFFTSDDKQFAMRGACKCLTENIGKKRRKKKRKKGLTNLTLVRSCRLSESDIRTLCSKTQ